MWELMSNVDYNYQPPAQVKPWETRTIQSAIDSVNSQLAWKWLKLELPTKSLDIAETDEEKQVLELVKKVWLKKSFENNIFSEWVKIKKIQEWVFIVISNKTWNVNYFIDNKWEILIVLVDIEDDYKFIKNWKALEFAWYEQKLENWKYNLYAVLNTWEKVLLNINSRFYYLAWKHIIFTNDLLSIIYIQEKRTKPLEENGIAWLEQMIENWPVKIENIEKLIEKWIITQEIFNRLLEKIKTILVAQCKDMRLIRIWAWIKESDIKHYYEKWYIDSKLALECYKVIPEENRDISGKSK
jgi:hypothetical protein